VTKNAPVLRKMFPRFVVQAIARSHNLHSERLPLITESLFYFTTA
jgi:hypothetical protein